LTGRLKSPLSATIKEPMPAKPKLGQNFLNDAQAAQRIADSLGSLAGRTVVEIGPGAGAITSALVARATHVIAVELDAGLAAHLRTRFPADRLTVQQQDVLNFDFASAAAEAGQKLLVFGNLPYYITSQILLKLAASHAALRPRRSDGAARGSGSHHGRSRLARLRAALRYSPVVRAGNKPFHACAIVLLATARRAFHRVPLAFRTAL
jgi:hypothetical protein